jgi:adenosylhomocysteine nucleosidase
MLAEGGRLMAGAAMQATEPRRSTSSDRAATGVIGVMREELAVLESRTKVTRRHNVGRCRLVHGRLGDVPIILVRTGEGRDNAAEGARLLLDRARLEQLIVVGFSGGLSPTLAPGSLLVSRQVLDGSTAAPPPEPSLVDELVRQDGVLAGTIVTSRRLLWTSQSKTAVWNSIPQHAPAAVDLETAAIAAEASSRGVPYVAIRAVSDPAEESLPIDFNHCLDATGRIDRLKVVGRAARRPGLIAPLWRLRKRASLCSERLADAVCRLVEGESR